MKAIWKFSGVNFVDIKEKGKLKIRGDFSKSDLGIKLQKIDKSIDFIDSKQIVKQDHKPVFSSFSNRSSNTPKTLTTATFRFQVLDDKILRKANIVIWEFPGVTSVQVKEEDQLEVIGEFHSIEMTKKLKGIDKYVELSDFDQVVEEAPPSNTQYHAGSSSLPQVFPKTKSTFRRARELEADKPNVNRPINQQAIGKAIAYEGAFGAQNFGQYNYQPAIRQQHQGGQLHGQNWQPIEQEERLRMEKEIVERQRIEKERVERQRIEKERVERQRIEKERAEKQRIERERAEKQRIERERAEKQRIERERAEKLRIEREKAEKLRIEREKAKGRGETTQAQSYWSLPTMTSLGSLWSSTTSTGTRTSTGPSSTRSSSISSGAWTSTGLSSTRSSSISSGGGPSNTRSSSSYGAWTSTGPSGTWSSSISSGAGPSSTRSSSISSGTGTSTVPRGTRNPYQNLR